ncbi:hypothetical protein [Aeromonas caviae]|uniref:hypothetical protein n=1 Tax=Aeromonas caviae TaxID=648 RepID=UPI002B46C5E2|nr:hypothetical protein [Aeromonas caviae]
MMAIIGHPLQRMGKGRLEYHGDVMDWGRHVHADDVRAVHKRQVTISQLLDFNLWRHEYQSLLIVLPCKAALGIGKQPFVGGLRVGDGELVEQLEESDIPGWSAANQHRRPLATLQDLEALGQLGVDVEQGQLVGQFGQRLKARLDGEAVTCPELGAMGINEAVRDFADRLFCCKIVHEVYLAD